MIIESTDTLKHDEFEKLAALDTWIIKNSRTHPVASSASLAQTAVFPISKPYAEQVKSIIQLSQKLRPALLAAAGGDGTASLVINELMKIPDAQRPTFTVIPSGTGNDFAKMIGLSRTDPLAILGRGFDTCIDVAKVDDRWFVNDLGAGIFSDATRMYHRLPAFFRTPRYLAAATLAIARNRRFSARIDIDGRTVHDGPLAFLALSNGAWTGGKFLLNPQGSITDGRLDLCVCKPISRRELLRNFPNLRNGAFASHPAIRRYQGQTIRIQSQTFDLYQLDGEIFPFPPEGLLITIQPKSLRVKALELPQFQ